MNLEDLKKSNEAPQWLNHAALKTLEGGYLLKDETPRGMYRRVAKSAAKYLKRPDLEDKFYEYIDRNWLCLATPVASNAGTDRGLPISCYGSSPYDTFESISDSVKESMVLTRYGGGIGKYWGDIRPKGSPIKNNGFTDGVIPWIKLEESVLQSTAQSGVRRGSGAMYLPIDSNEIIDFIELKRNTGDLSRRCLSNSLHHAVCISDSFMQKCMDGDPKSQEIWDRLMTAGIEKGEPYLMFPDNANRQKPECYKALGLDIKMSQLCNEIYLYSDGDHTFVCCLSSLNAARYDEWKDTDLVETAIYFLDGIMSEFIDKASGIDGFQNAVRFSEKSRALGLGILGWHTLLQKKMIPFESFQAMQLNNELFKLLDERSLAASKQLAAEYGEVEWTKGFGIRNTHRIAVAPTLSNSILSGGVSQGIEPIEGNYYMKKTAKGSFLIENPLFLELLKSKGADTQDVWDQVNADVGSCRNLKFLSDLEKQVFLTAREINQFAIVRQAAQRQQYIDQGQSMNLFFNVPENPDDFIVKQKFSQYVHDVHFKIWEMGLKGRYYLKTDSLLKGDSVFREESECLSCHA